MLIREFLARIPIFSDLSREDLALLTELWQRRSVKKLEAVFHKGDVGSSMFIVEDGEVEISVLGDGNGNNVRVSVVKPGGFFGELALISNLPRSATSTAISDCHLLEMNRDDFVKFLSTRPAVAISMIDEIGKRLQATNELVTSLASKNVNVEMDEQMSVGDRLADKVSDFVGSWRFIIYYSISVATWCGLNMVQAMFAPFDPYPFAFLNLVLALATSLQAPLIMMSQNRAQTKDHLRAEMDYQVSLKSELMLQQLHAKIDELRGAGRASTTPPKKSRIVLRPSCSRGATAEMAVGRFALNRDHIQCTRHRLHVPQMSSTA